jgi:hypothetical protein
MAGTFALLVTAAVIAYFALRATEHSAVAPALREQAWVLRDPPVIHIIERPGNIP